MGKVLGVIPARLNSTRLSRKMLASIGGQPLIYYTYHQAKKAKKLDYLIIATDSKEIRNVAESFGATVIMTSSKHKSGSDRVAEAARKFTKFKPQSVINIQGDEPLIEPSVINRVSETTEKNKTAVMVTAATPLKPGIDISKPNVVKVVIDRKKDALYFSRSVIPFSRNLYKNYLKHIGIFGYKADFLQYFVRLKQTPLELAESLEQLRILENKYKINVIVGNFKDISVDTEEDLKKVKKLINKKIKNV